ncbi:uncharacterized protein LOC142239163 [Haematobia irritans]|uniref:uncharacterized protein LOC142239163 n=1 Tax=Haematobia irritans TaxID=7368 RepID=UPI003F50D0CE
MSGESLESPSVSTGLETPTFRDVPLSALSKGSRKKLSHLMNAKKILRSEDGYERDWRGLAFLAKQKNLCDDNIISGDDPMAKLIQLWCINNPNTATFAHLEKFLGVIDRWDVCDDLYEYLEQKTRKIIPLLYESSIEIPRTLNIYTHLRYNASSMGFCDYWTKLANSIRNVNIGETLLRNPVVECEIHSTPLTSNRHLFPTSQAVENKQTPSTEIPSISINGNIVVPSECNQSLKMVDRPAARPLTMRRNRSNNGLTAPVPVLRNAHSTDHLHSSIEFNNAVSMSNISTSSESKKKKKWSKLLNKVFSRSNSKLQQQTT